MRHRRIRFFSGAYLCRRCSRTGASFSMDNQEMFVSPTFWTAIAATAGTIYTAAFIISVLVLRRQLNASRTATFAQAFGAVTAMLSQPDVTLARWTVMNRRTRMSDRFDGLAEDFNGNTVSTRAEHAALVCRTYNALGVMVEHGMLAKVVALDAWGDDVAILWSALAEFVAAERVSRDSADLWKHFERLARFAQDRSG